MHQKCVNVGLFISLGCMGGGAEGGKQSLLPISHMAIFELPIGPPITKKGSTCLMSKAHACCGNYAITKLLYGSITYDYEKGTMPLEWENEIVFLV